MFRAWDRGGMVWSFGLALLSEVEGFGRCRKEGRTTQGSRGVEDAGVDKGLQNLKPGNQLGTAY